jgi:hypothetical protein
MKTRWMHQVGGYCVYVIILYQVYMGVTDILIMLNMSEYSFLPLVFVILPIIVFGITAIFLEYITYRDLKNHKTRDSIKKMELPNSLQSLPTYTWEEIGLRLSQGNKWVVISDIICLFHCFIFNFFI